MKCVYTAISLIRPQPPNSKNMLSSRILEVGKFDLVVNHIDCKGYTIQHLFQTAFRIKVFIQGFGCRIPL